MQVRNELIISQYQNFTGQYKFKEHSAVLYTFNNGRAE